MKPIYLLKTAVLSSVLLLSAKANAQMTGGDVFLKGRFVEVGIGHLGYYGSDAAAPTGYHSHCTGCVSGLGFVADPAMDGWATGTPAYMGDYFAPGSPFEGWALQVDGKRCQGYNGGPGSTFTYGGGMGTCTGANTGYAATGSAVVGTWTGMIDSVQIEQITTLDSNDAFFTVKIKLTNTAVAPKNDLYYFRSLDPDNDQQWPGGSFVTHNKITHQMPGDPANASVVTATGSSTSTPVMALGSADTNSRVMIYNAWSLTATQDLAAVYGETYGGAFYDVGTDHFGDIGLALTMYIPHLATVDSAGDSVMRTTAAGALHPANTATFTYFFAFNNAAVDSAIARHNAVPAHPGALGIKNVNNAAEIKVYPNPSKETINVTGLNTTDRVSLIDIMGRDMGQSWQVKSQGVNTFSYTNMPAGAYILVVTDANGNVKSRATIKKQ